MANKDENPGVNGYSFGIQKTVIVDKNGDVKDIDILVPTVYPVDRGTGTDSFRPVSSIHCNKDGYYRVTFSGNTTYATMFLVAGMTYNDWEITNILSNTGTALTAGDITLLYNELLPRPVNMLTVPITDELGTLTIGTITYDGTPQNIVFNTAETPTFAYQWYMDGVAIESADESTYEHLDVAGSYTVVVTATVSAIGTITSNAVVVSE